MGLIPVGGGASLPNSSTLSKITESGGNLLFNGTPIAEGEASSIAVETRILTAEDLVNKYFDLMGVALPAKDINFYVGGGELFRGVDWALIQVGGVYRRISWDSLPAEGVLTEGDSVRVEYYEA